MIVYISGPYSNGDKELNVQRAIKAADALVKKGHTPFIPHLTHYWDLVSPKPYSFWLEYDCKFLCLCDCLLRLPGESYGADHEVRWAVYNGIPVYHSIGEL